MNLRLRFVGDFFETHRDIGQRKEHIASTLRLCTTNLCAKSLKGFMCSSLSPMSLCVSKKISNICESAHTFSLATKTLHAPLP
jgi:hypothetical protein